MSTLVNPCKTIKAATNSKLRITKIHWTLSLSQQHCCFFLNRSPSLWQSEEKSVQQTDFVSFVFIFYAVKVKHEARENSNSRNRIRIAVAASLLKSRSSFEVRCFNCMASTLPEDWIVVFVWYVSAKSKYKLLPANPIIHRDKSNPVAVVGGPLNNKAQKLAAHTMSRQQCS